MKSGTRDTIAIVGIAVAAGMSKSTVSLVPQGSGAVRAPMRERVNRAIRDFSYIDNRGAANLRRARSNIVGMIINDLTNPFDAKLAVGIDPGLPAARHLLFIANTAGDPPHQAEVAQRMREQGLAGIVVAAARGTPEDAFDSLAAAGVPVVLAMRGLSGRRSRGRAEDDVSAVQLAVRESCGGAGVNGAEAAGR